MTAAGELSIFALDPDQSFAPIVAQCLGVSPAPLEDRVFEDGEYKIRPLESVRGHDAYVISSLYHDENASSADRLLKMLFFIGALRDAGVGRVTAATPYLCFARKDRRTKPRDPVTTRYVAQLFEAMRIDGLIGIDIHNLAAFQNAFRCETIHLDAQALFAKRLVADIGDASVTVVSPDLGGDKRAELFRQRLERLLKKPVGKGFMDKFRSEGRVSSDIFAGDVENRIAIVIDDLIAGGGTLARVAAACKAHGARAVWGMATHGVFTAGAPAILADAPLDLLMVADTAPQSPSSRIAKALGDRLMVVSAAPLFGEAIRRRHLNLPITELLENGL